MILALGFLPLPIVGVMKLRLNWILHQLIVPGVFEQQIQVLEGDVFADEASGMSPIIPTNDTPPYLTLPIRRALAWGNRHEQLFWFGRHGKAVLVLFVRFVLHIQATYVALIFVMAVTGSLDVSQLCADCKSAGVFLSILLGTPPIIFALILPSILETLVVVTNIEMMKNAENIRRVVREMKTRKALKALKLLITLQLDREATQAVAIFHPIDTSHIVLPESLMGLCEVITRASHMQWFNEQRATGWKYGNGPDFRGCFLNNVITLSYKGKI